MGAREEEEEKLKQELRGKDENDANTVLLHENSPKKKKFKVLKRMNAS